MKLFNYPKWLRIFYPESVWGFKAKQKLIYLSFDDGPNETSTIWILNCLKSYQAKATFFCLGNQVAKHPELMAMIESDGHAIGNHSMEHPNGFKTSLIDYVADVQTASELIDSKLFRPPYGKITSQQFKALKNMGYKIVFWSLLTYDFDQYINPDKILSKVKTKSDSGDIIVFHDSQKAFKNIQYLLPKLLKFYSNLGYKFAVIE